MNFDPIKVSNPVAAIDVADGPASLSAFARPECAASIWRRQMPEDIQDWLDRLDPERLPRGRVILRPDEVADTFGQLCDIAQTPPGPERDWLQKDVAALAGMFAGLMSARFLRLRLDVVTTNSCRKFHIDAITARLICTYRGTGTQYGISANREDPSDILTVPTGAPILLRGTLWPETPSAGLLHRSPPIEGKGETRLILFLDPVFDPEDEV